MTGGRFCCLIFSDIFNKLLIISLELFKTADVLYYCNI